MTIKFANNISTTLALGAGIAATSFDVASTTGFPTLGVGDYFYGTLSNTLGAIEIVQVTSWTGVTVTCTRGAEGTPPAAWSTGDSFEIRITAAGLTTVLNATEVVEEVQTATSGQTVFTLTTFMYVPGENTLSVYVDGVNQIVDLSYTETGTTTVTFIAGLHLGALVKFTTLRTSGLTTSAAVVTYEPAGTGAVATTVQAKLRESVSVLDFGAVGDGVTDDTAAIQYAMNAAGIGVVYFPAGTYKISASITTQGSWYGCGRGTIIKPTGDFPAFIVQSAHLNGDEFGLAYGYMVDYQSVITPTVLSSAHWLNKGATNSGTSSTGSFRFSNIYVYGSYHAFYQSSADVAILWNVSFDNIVILASKDYGIYIDGSGSLGSLQVTFDNILIDGIASTTAKGSYLRALGKVKFHGITTGVGSAITGGVLYAIDCSNIQVDIQCESITVTTPDIYLVAFLNCHQVKVREEFTSIVTNVGVGNTYGLNYFDVNNEGIVVEGVFVNGPVNISGSYYKVVVNAAATSATKLQLLDKTVLVDEVSVPSAILAQSVMTPYGSTIESTNRSTVNSSQIIYTWLDNNSVGAEPQSAFVMVSGTMSTNSNVGFTDLVLVYSSTSNAFTKILTVVSTNNAGAADARTYTQDSTGSLKCATAANTYYIRTTALHGYAPYR